MIKYRAFVLLAALLSVPAAFAQQTDPLKPAAAAPVLLSRSAVLMDAATGTLLFSHNPSERIPPASLTKLMTIHLALKEIEAGRAGAGEIVPLPPESWAENQSAHSSLMFLGRGQRVTLGELLLGMAVSSGNDAAVAAALRFAPSIEAFASLMNAEAGALGLSATYFVEPAGISGLNQTSAADFARFCRYYLQRHPQSTVTLHSVRQFAYPQAANTPASAPRTILQYSHNPLLGVVEGVDGLKTGHINEAGYNIALTAKRGASRFIAVLLGARTEDDRDADAKNLLEWGFANYQTLDLGKYNIDDYLSAQRVWKSREKFVPLTVTGGMLVTIATSRGGVLEWEAEPKNSVEAPVKALAPAGSLVVRDRYGELVRLPLAFKSDAARGGVFRVLFDGIALFFRKLFGRAG
ncbi:MAG: D-alanyl-D-alanine carboxypeptidase [Treponema sp.]|jgi:D-alanyl-D-alanine carboxypeptidase (penicillin-binding protein 5/6)|nr:D-alanyl-D-alanine carboxypeptidase [Treponema sp.]